MQLIFYLDQHAPGEQAHQQPANEVAQVQTRGRGRGRGRARGRGRGRGRQQNHGKNPNL